MKRKQFTKLEQEIWELVTSTGINRSELLDTVQRIYQLMSEA